MFDRDIELIWENFVNKAPKWFSDVVNIWNEKILPSIECDVQDELDYNIVDGGKIIIIPHVRFIYESDLDYEMFGDHQLTGIKNRFEDAFGDYSNMHIEKIEYADDDADKTNKIWIAVYISLDEAAIPLSKVHKYFEFIKSIDSTSKKIISQF